MESSDPLQRAPLAAPPGPYGKEGRVGRGWRLTKVAWTLIRRDRTMVILAFVGIAGATLFTALIFVLGGLFSHSGNGHDGRFGLVALTLARFDHQRPRRGEQLAARREEGRAGVVLAAVDLDRPADDDVHDACRHGGNDLGRHPGQHRRG